MKTTATIGLKNEHKYSPMSEGNTCIGEPPNLEVLPLIIIQYGTSLVFLLIFKNNVSSDDTYKVSLLYYQMATNSAVNKNLACVINNCNNSSY